MNRGRTIGYWVCTGVIFLTQGASGVLDLIGAESIVEGITALGYPAYVLTILGVWKLAGVVTLVLPGFPLIKEWAYAGFFFDFSGAAASHAMNGDGVAMVAPPVVGIAILVTSYVLRPPSRRLVTS